MVKELHRAGIEVILDVVYNHSAEGNHLGPTLSFKGFDNPGYYRLVADDPRFYFDYTGTGNTLNMRNPYTLQLVMDSLRWWVTEMHVDGFRFDLASTLARSLHEVDRLSAFFDLVQQDPVLNQVKLIAEPWDIGEGGYQVGNFPPQWAEWNGKYRDEVRDFWRGEDCGVGELAYRLTGSSDLYESESRRPHASINFVTAHDGFTLTDLVSYNEKHNEANGEDGNDGESHNRSWNCGAEGPTDDAEVLAPAAPSSDATSWRRCSSARACPMLLHGDELGRTQQGNNNAYCQDNEISWIDWSNLDEDLLTFTSDAHRAAAPPPHLPAAAVLPGPPDPRAGRRTGAAGHRLVRPRRHRDDRRAVAGDARQLRRRLPQRRRRRHRPARRPRHRRPLPAPAQRPPRADPVHAATGAVGIGVAGRARHHHGRGGSRRPPAVQGGRRRRPERSLRHPPPRRAR